MKCSKKCADHSGCSSNMADLLSSVKTLIDNLSDERPKRTSAKQQQQQHSKSAVGSAAATAAAVAAAEIDKQLERLDQLFAKSSERRRRKQLRRRQLEQQQQWQQQQQQQQQWQQQQQQQQQQEVKKTKSQQPRGDICACSRSPCSNCTTSNCNAINCVSLSDSSEGSNGVVRCCAISANTKCPSAAKQLIKSGDRLQQQQQQHHQQQQQQQQPQQQQQQLLLTSLQKQAPEPVPVQVRSASNSSCHRREADTMSMVSQNASNRRQFVVRRGRRTEQSSLHRQTQSETQILRRSGNAPPNFSYLKEGLGGVAESGGRNCGSTVIQMERMVKSLRILTDRLCRQYEVYQRQQRKNQTQSGCSWENPQSSARLSADIRQAKARATCLRNCLKAVLGGGGSSGGGGAGSQGACGDGPGAAVGCRHRGEATEISRDPIVDIKCKFERSLLFTRSDVNWPFLHIIAPSHPDFSAELCCSED